MKKNIPKLTVGNWSLITDQGIRHMFKPVILESNQHALDFGCGLGGVACYLAKNHGMRVTALDVNEKMIARNQKNLPEELTDLVTYVYTEPNVLLPFEEDTFDIVYSKGVLVHLTDENIKRMFHEFFRVLKAGGTLVILDWLSAKEGEWCEKVHQLCAMEPLILFPRTEMNYFNDLKAAGFKNIKMLDDNPVSYQWNLEIIDRLQEPVYKRKYIQELGEKIHENALKGYQLIGEATRTGDALVRRFIAKKFI